MSQEQQYHQALDGIFSSLLRWEDLDRFWDLLRSGNLEQWYIYAIGEPPPQQRSGAEDFLQFIDEIDQLLRRDHQERICGIVYANHTETPSMVKIYDPNNLGLSCGSSKTPPLPGWILSHQPPVDLHPSQPTPMNRRRWWQRLFTAA